MHTTTHPKYQAEEEQEKKSNSSPIQNPIKNTKKQAP